MFKILKHLKPYKWIVLVIVALLVVQAYCDLSLPQYTSAIVDVGIQQGGVEETIPDAMRAATLDDLALWMTAEQAGAMRAAYALDGDIYRLKALTPEEMEALHQAMAGPIAILTFFQAGMVIDEAMLRQVISSLGETSIDTAASMAAANGMDVDFMLRLLFGKDTTLLGGAVSLFTQAQSGITLDMNMVKTRLAEGAIDQPEMLAFAAQMLASFGDNSAMIQQQQAISFVRAEYTALGRDMAGVQTGYLWSTGLKMLGVTLGMVAAAIASGFLSARTAAGVGMTLRARVFQKVVAFSSGDMDKFSAASLITRSTNDIQQVQMVSVMLLRMVIYSPILGIGGIIKVANTRTGMGWIIAVAVITLMALVGVLVKIAMPKFKMMQTLIDRINLVAREMLSGLMVIRAFGREPHESERFDVANKNLTRTQLFTHRVMTFMMPVMMLIMNGISVMIVWFGAQGIEAGNLQVGDLIAFITYTMQIVMSFLMLTMLSVMLPRATVAAGRIDEVLDAIPSIQDAPDAQAEAPLEGTVAFEDVSFRYPDAAQDVLEHITFTARPGQTTAIIGSTGSGKTTLLNLIPRFFDVTAGRVTLGGVDVRHITQHALRAQLGYVPQKGVLFSGTIASNIKYGGEEITDADMEQAAAIAQASDFISEKKDGYEDPIAQGGTNVSGGQKQRLAIARALAKHPRVLLFDDSFSALDYRTDATLRQALAQNLKDVTVIIVAQRINTILHADQILVLDEGRAAGLGTHQELMESCPAYQEIARSQLSEAELKGGQGA
ncbi:MAG: ABC transporter ATP-binding protein/permease [Oscillospiraceae bacterium]|jgi:ATP-binding cassette subfamily B protein|nr:ABC transporter ATP-binding protein/permease [Oscillospiraceae bacterium]